jgi:hypothetical protein
MPTDKIKYHVDDAGSEERAAAHMAIFLEWAARNDLLSDMHDRDKLLADPVRYVIDEVPNLADCDFKDEALAFVNDQYDEYVDYLVVHAADVGMSSYEYAATPEGREDMLECLDEALAEFEEEEGPVRPTRERRQK